MPRPPGCARAPRRRQKSDRNVLLVEQTLEPPNARPRAVFVNRFHRQIAVLWVHDVGNFAQAHFISAIGGHMNLRTFLKVDDNVNGDPRLVRPHNLWHVFAIANIVPLGTRDLVLWNFHDVLPPNLLPSYVLPAIASSNLPATWRPSIWRCMSRTLSMGMVCTIGMSSQFSPMACNTKSMPRCHSKAFGMT